jgi:hypothetical protein
MKRAALGLALVLTVFAAVPPTRAQETCRPDLLIGGPSGALTITQHAVVRQLGRNCPVLANEPDAVIYRSRQRVHIWYRLEGDLTYLHTVQPSDRFSARLWRLGEAVSSNELLTLSNDTLNVVATSGEAAVTGGRFDWRFHVNFVPLLPGTYRLQLFHGGRMLCRLDELCDVTIEVQQ